MTDFFLRILHHDGSEELRDLPPGRWEIGRGEGCWLAPLDPALSRRHALLSVSEREVAVEALPSRNGTLVNGERLSEPRRLSSGDEILVGRTLLKLGTGTSALERARSQRTVELKEGAEGEPVAASEAMKRLLAEARRLARTPLPVLVHGETGSGKEVLAAYLHAQSSRAEGPFVVLNCPALPPGLVESELFGVEAGAATGVTAREGLLERADGGTLFLDEVGDLPGEVQPKLLRFLQDRNVQRVGGRRTRTVDVRIVAATHHDLRRDAEAGAFRLDLFHRLAGAVLVVPPLRERPEDVEALAVALLARLPGPSRHLSAEALEALKHHPFPGNVRELLLVVERAAHLTDGAEIDVATLSLPDAVERTAGNAGEGAARLLEELAAGRRDFWTDVYEPWRRREVKRPLLEELVRLGLARGDGTVLGLARVLRSEDRYRKLLDFLRNAKLLPR